MGNSDLVDVDAYLHHETEKAILVSAKKLAADKDKVWLPKSQVEFVVRDKRTGLIEVTLPEWVAIDKGLA